MNAEDSNGNTALMYVIKDKPEHMTVEMHRQVVQLLMSFGIDALRGDKAGNTALHTLASFPDTSFDPYIALQLIQHGGYSARRTVSHALEARNANGLTPFMVNV